MMTSSNFCAELFPILGLLMPTARSSRSLEYPETPPLSGCWGTRPATWNRRIELLGASWACYSDPLVECSIYYPFISIIDNLLIFFIR